MDYDDNSQIDLEEFIQLYNDISSAQENKKTIDNLEQEFNNLDKNDEGVILFA